MYWSLENVPWTNLHDLNLDWIVNTMKETVEQWIAYRIEMNQKYEDFTTQVNEDFDAFTAQINAWKSEVESDFSDLQQYVQNYFDNLDLNESTRYVIDQMIASGEFIQVLNPSIVSTTEAWLASHITPTSPVVDDTLTISGAAADAKTTGDRLQNLNTELQTYNINDYIINHGVMQSAPHNGVTYTWADSKCTVSGTASPASFSNYLVMDIQDIKEFTLIHESTDNNIMSRVYFVDGQGSMTLIDTRTTRIVPVPTSCVRIIVRLQVNSGVTVNGTVYVRVISNLPLNYYPAPKAIEKYISNNTLNLNNVLDEGRYIFANNITLQNAPLPSATGVLLVEKATGFNNWTCQKLWLPNNGDQYIRWNTVDNWTPWTKESPALTVWQNGLPTETDLDTLITNSHNGYYILSDARTYYNSPITVGFLFVCTIGNTCLQICISWNGFIMYKRRSLNNLWSNWETISGGSGGNEYNFYEYNNTYNVTATPSITTDTNNYLQTTGTTADRTNDIATMLATTGVCNLGPGDFYVFNLEMPVNSILRGSGSKTRIILSGTNDGFAIKLNTKCLVANLEILGSLTSIAISSNLGGRHGILWQGNYAQSLDSSIQPTYGLISNCWISQFTGGGITCYDTGYATYNHIQVTNVDINGCRAGINLNYWTEFHKFANVTTMNCWYGVINNGGNNFFVNCEFANCEIGMLFENSNDQSPNNTHGSVIGCMFGHCGRNETGGSGINQGYAIKMFKCTNGEIFSGCQIAYGKIYTSNSNGVVFDGCNFMGGVIGQTNFPIVITIEHGRTHLITNSMFSATPTISITDNINTHFSNCYNREGGSPINP